MPTENFDIVGSYNNQRVLSIDAERSVNMFEYIDPLGKKPKILINTSGLDTSHVDFGATVGGFRQSFVFNDTTFHVIGQDIWEVRLIGSILTPIWINPLLPLTTTTGYVGIDANEFQIIFVDGVKGYIWDTNTSVFEEITDESFPPQPIDVCYLDGFFVVAEGSTNNFQLSSFNQGLVWGPDSASVGNTFVATSGSSPNLVLTTGSTLNYQIGTPIQFTIGIGGVLPVSAPVLVAGDNYYVTSIVDSTTFTISATPGGTDILFTTVGTAIITLTNNGQLQQGEITSHPGNIVACRTLHRNLFLFSRFYTEVWENAGIGTNLPFRRNNSLLMEYGTPAIGSISVGFDKMIFLSLDREGLGSVMQVSGTESVPISTRALDYQLAQYISTTGIADCRGFFMRESGLIFYRMNFTTSDHTFVYNLTMSDPSQEQTRLWHEEEMLDHSRHVAQTHVFYNGLNFVGHYTLPILYEVDPQAYDNDGEHIRRVRISRDFCPPGYQRIRIDRYQLDLLQGSTQNLIFDNAPILTESGLDILAENGNFLETEQEVPVNQVNNPEIFISISKDGGQTYGNVLNIPMGNEGNRIFRSVIRKLGTTVRGQGFVVKLEFYDPVPLVVLGSSWAYEILPE